MGRTKNEKNNPRLTISIRPEVQSELEWFMEEANFTKTKVVENAIMYYVECFRNSGMIPVHPKKAVIGKSEEVI